MAMRMALFEEACRVTPAAEVNARALAEAWMCHNPRNSSFSWTQQVQARNCRSLDMQSLNTRTLEGARLLRVGLLNFPILHSLQFNDVITSTMFQMASWLVRTLRSTAWLADLRL
jgi:hypothetical protein